MSLLSMLQDQGPGCLLEICLRALGSIISFITSVLNEVGKCVRFFFFNEKLMQHIWKRNSFSDLPGIIIVLNVGRGVIAL